MKPIEQTVMGYPEGNCFAACIASLLETELIEPPDTKGPWWERGWHRYLEPFGLHMVMVQLVQEENNGYLAPRGSHLDGTHYQEAGEGDGWEEYRGIVLRGYSILGALSPRIERRLHAVVCLDGRVVWDPHPERKDGLGEWRDMTFLTVLDPARMIHAR
jgi:hypothetical protein